MRVILNPMKKSKMTPVVARKRVRQPLQRSVTKEEKLAKAYHNLGITQQQVIDTPKITHILAKLPGPRGHSGISAAIEFLRGTDDDLIRKFLSLWDDMPPSIHDQLPFEAFCLATGITTKRMLEIITGACFEQSDAAVKLVAAAAHPAVVRATVNAAMYPDGYQDRKMLHLNKGFLPVSKNQTTILSGHARQTNLQINDNSDNSDNSTNNGQRVTYAIGEVVGIEKKQERIADRFNERLGMGSGARVAEPRLVATIESATTDTDPSDTPDLVIDPDSDTSEPLGDWSV